MILNPKELLDVSDRRLLRNAILPSMAHLSPRFSFNRNGLIRTFDALFDVQVRNYHLIAAEKLGIPVIVLDNSRDSDQSLKEIVARNVKFLT